MNNNFEDISSSSKKEEFIDLSSMSTKRHYKKKKRGIAGLFSRLGERISNWWKKASKLKKATVITLSSVVAIILACVIFITTFFDYNYNHITADPDDLGFEEVIDKKVVNIALFGIDTRSKGFKGNSDSIMILSLNMNTKQVKIVSILRDSLVRIEHKGKVSYNKINSAYAKGGPELAIKTINENFGLDISEYATVNFEGMADIIDAVGGIDAELTKGEVAPLTSSTFALNACIAEICYNKGIDSKKYLITTPGKHHLNGIQAVAYSRIRKTSNIWGTNNDHGRTDRQRYVMEQLFNKALSLKKSDYIKLIKALTPCTETSISYTQALSYASNILLKSPSFSQSRVPLDDYQITKGVPSIKGVGSIVYYDLDFVSELLHAFFYDDITPEEYIETNGVRKNSWYTGATTGSSGNSGSTKPSASNTSSSTSTTSSTVSSTTSSTTSNGNNNIEDNEEDDNNSNNSSSTPEEDDNNSNSSTPDTSEDQNSSENNSSPENKPESSEPNPDSSNEVNSNEE